MLRYNREFVLVTYFKSKFQFKLNFEKAKFKTSYSQSPRPDVVVGEELSI
jgi:hypothetical protein